MMKKLKPASQPDQRSRVVTINGKTLVYLGKPLVGGDLQRGDVVSFNRFTGEVLSIERGEPD